MVYSIAITARLDLVGRRQQLDVNLKMAAPGPGGLLPQVGVDLEHGIGDGPVIPLDVLVDSGLRPVPQVFDVGFLVEGRQQR